MSDDVTRAADERLEAALAEASARDPREFYRTRLRELKAADSEGYERAVAYYREVLIPGVASGEMEPLPAWTEYGRRLASALHAGRTVSVDRTGLAAPFEGHDSEALVLHLPDQAGRALLVGLPSDLSPAQRATYDVLVDGKQRARDP